MKYLFVLFGILFLALFFLAPQWSAKDAPVCGRDMECAYDDVEELNRIIKENFDETLADVSRKHDVGASEGVSSEDVTERKKTALDVPPPPGVVVLAGGGAITPEEKEELQESVDLAINPDEGVLLAVEQPPQQTVKYDDAEWHYDGDFPEDVPIDNAYSHIGFYLTWAAENDLISELVKTQSPPLVLATRLRLVSPIELLKFWDDKLISDMLTEEGIAFTDFYYEDSEDGYLPDYMAEFADYRAYEVKPNWKNYDRIKPVIDRRYQEWLVAKD